MSTCGGYDNINYDESFYDCESFVEVASILSLSWGLEPLPEDDGMSSTMAYEFNLTGTDPDGLIKTQAEVSDDVPITGDVVSDDTYDIPAGAIDFPLHVIAADIDILAIIPKKGQVITVKVNSLLGTPFAVKKLLFLDGEGVTAVYVTNPGLSSTRVRAVMAAR